MGHIKHVPRDDNQFALLDRCTEIGSKTYSNVDVATGVTVSLTVDVKTVTIITSAAATFQGTISGYTDAIPIGTGPLTLPICVVENTSLFTIKAVAATITVYLIFGR